MSATKHLARRWELNAGDIVTIRAPDPRHALCFLAHQPTTLRDMCARHQGGDATLTAALDLLLVADSVEGGLGASAQAHARWFGARGWRVALAAPGVEANAAFAAVPLDVPDGAFQVVAMIRAARHLRRIVRRSAPRIIHAHGTRSQLLTLMAGRMPYVSMHGGGRMATQGTLSAALRRSARRVAGRLAVRAYSAAPTTGRWQLLLHASPRLAELHPSPVPVDGTPTFLWVGRLEAPKRPDVFVRACAEASRVIAVQGVVVGDGPMRQQLASLIEQLDAPVHLAGVQDDVGRYLEDAWALCLFSDFEGVPFAVQEAMWVGRTAVVSPLPSLEWFCGDAVEYAGDARAAARLLVRLSEGATAADRGRAASGRVRALITPEAPFPELLSDYDRALR